MNIYQNTCGVGGDQIKVRYPPGVSLGRDTSFADSTMCKAGTKV